MSFVISTAHRALYMYSSVYTALATALKTLLRTAATARTVEIAVIVSDNAFRKDYGFDALCFSVTKETLTFSDRAFIGLRSQ